MTARFEEEGGGFTLIELLVVIIIIGILAAIAIPVFLAQRERAWRSEMQSDLRIAAVSLEAYYVDRGVYSSDALESEFGYRKSPDTTLSLIVPGDGQSFCAVATHDLLDGETWQIGTFTSLSPGDCS